MLRPAPSLAINDRPHASRLAVSPRTAHALERCALPLFLALAVTGCAGAGHADPPRPESGVAFLPVEPGLSVEAGRPAPADAAGIPELGPDSTVDDYLRAALLVNPAVEAAHQRWLAASARAPQVGALPDPRATFGYFIEEVETRVGPQEYRLGLQQSFPWPGTLGRRAAAAERQAHAAWRRLEATQLTVAESLLRALHDLGYLDRAIAITRENLQLLASFEEVIRARYRVGNGSHPELIRVQVELGQLEDRLAQLEALRPSHVADVNAALGRPAGRAVDRVPALPGRVVTASPDELIAVAEESNPTLRALTEESEAAREQAAAAQRSGYPDLTLGVEYIGTGEAVNPGTPGSGDDPVIVSLGIGLPIWRGRVDAAVREALAQQRAHLAERARQEDQIASAVHRAWFEHADADRRLRLYQRTLIPKAEEALQSTLAGFRTGESSFLDLLDSERTLLEFDIAAARARAERGKALARLQSLVAQPIPTRLAASDRIDDHEETEDRP